MSFQIDPTQLRLTSSELNLRVMDFWELLIGLRRDLNRIEMNWSGSSASENWSTQFREVLYKLTQSVESADHLVMLMRRQADQWEESDLLWTNVYGSIPGSMSTFSK